MLALTSNSPLYCICSCQSGEAMKKHVDMGKNLACKFTRKGNFLTTVKVLTVMKYKITRLSNDTEPAHHEEHTKECNWVIFKCCSNGFNIRKKYNYPDGTCCLENMLPSDKHHLLELFMANTFRERI